MRAPHLLILALLITACDQGAKPELGQMSQAIALPSGFNQSVVASVSEPTAFAFLPDGRMLITSRRGKVHVLKGGELLSTAAIDLAGSTCPERERGLLGVAVDPSFASNKQVYLFYTRKKSHCDLHDQSGNGAVNRVSRFTYDTDSDRLSNETVLVDHMLSYNGWHNGGDLQFGPDGYLYITIGDWGAKLGQTSTGWNNDNPRHRSLLAGKILRVVKETGAPAPGNPWLGLLGSRRCGDPTRPGKFVANSSEPCQETYATGLRNPFRIAFKPGTSTFFINEVGQNIGGDYEEVNEGKAGADYGWNRNQGPTNDGSTTAPVYAYSIGEEVGGKACRSITGGAFAPDGALPDAYDDAYFFGDYVCGALFYLKKQGNSWTRTTFATDLGGSSVVHLGFGPNPQGGLSLYYTSFEGDQVLRIDPKAQANNAPTAMLTASPTAGATPLTVEFDGSQSFDNDAGDSISRYMWNFGDGSAEQTTSSPAVTHTYDRVGDFTARLTVEDTRAPRKRASATVIIQAGREPPSVRITSPTKGQTFVVNQPLSLTATASDPEDGTLSGSALEWTVRRVHDDHTHPFFSVSGNDAQLTVEGPEGLAAATTSYYTVTATATDSTGLAASAEVDIQPRLVDLTFRTSPDGFSLRVDDTDVLGQATLTSWEGYAFRVAAPTQVHDGKTYQLKSWSDGVSSESVITTPSTARTYTATFEEGGVSANINFQPDSAVTPDGYLKDNGAAFAARAGGLHYGWSEDNQSAARERNNPASRDKRYDTTILLQKSGDKFWEIEVPSGSYELHLVAGDADHDDSIYDITAEGTTVLSGTPTSDQRWIEARATVVVSDGRLTLDNGPTAHNNKLCFVELVSTPPDNPDDPDTRGPDAGGGDPGGPGDGDNSGTCRGVCDDSAATPPRSSSCAIGGSSHGAPWPAWLILFVSVLLRARARLRTLRSHRQLDR
jgi:glucose/arabinose dehydrogenase